MKTKLLLMLSVGIIMLAACKGKFSPSGADSAQMQTTDSVKLVKTAGMRLKVKNVQQTAEGIDQLTASYGGMVVHNYLQSNVIDKQDIVLPNDSLMKMTVYNSAAEMTVRVPSENLEEFMDKLNHLSVMVDERKMNIADRTLDYLSDSLKAENRARAINLKSHLKNTENSASDILALKDNIVDKRIGNLKIADSARFSIVNLSLYQNNTLIREVTANDDLSLYNVSFLVRLKLAISRGWFYFSELIVLILHLWGFILAGAVIWITMSVYKKRKFKKSCLCL